MIHVSSPTRSLPRQVPPCEDYGALPRCLPALEVAASCEAFTAEGSALLLQPTLHPGRFLDGVRTANPFPSPHPMKTIPLYRVRNSTYLLPVVHISTTSTVGINLPTACKH